LETQKCKWIFEDESWFGLATFFSLKFFEKNCSSMPKWPLKSIDFKTKWKKQK